MLDTLIVTNFTANHTNNRSGGTLSLITHPMPRTGSDSISCCENTPDHLVVAKTKR